MNIYLLPWEEDQPGHFRLQGVEQAGPYCALDFRAPSQRTTAGGFGIASTAGTIDVSGIGNGRLLGTSLDAPMPALVRTFLRNRLGLAAGEDAATPRALLQRLLVEHGREDGTRWRSIQPRRVDNNHVYDLVLNGELVFSETVPVVRGGATYTESFTGTNADLDAADIDLTWEELIGDWDVVSNHLQCQGGANDCFARANSNAATADQYCQAAISGSTTDGADRGGVTVQEQSASSSTATNYVAFIRGDGDLILEETLSGSGTELGSASPGYSSGATLRLEREGSSLVVKYDGSTEISTSDGTLTANRRGGVYGKLASGPLITIDSWEFGDYPPAAAAASLIPRRRRPPLALLRGGF